MTTVEEVRELRHTGSTSDLPPDARDVTKPGAMNARTKPMVLTEALGNAPYLWNPVFNRGIELVVRDSQHGSDRQVAATGSKTHCKKIAASI